MGNFKVLFYFIFVFYFTSCKHEVPVVLTPPPDDTVWSELPTQVRQTGTVYFHNDIQKLMITKCAVDGYKDNNNFAGCHTDFYKKAGVVLDTYSGVFNEVDDDFDPDKSDLYEALTDDEDPMPVVGSITPGDANMLRDWITQGAQNNKCNPCNDYVPGSFRDGVALILYKNCSGCHNEVSQQGGVILFGPAPTGPEDIDVTQVTSRALRILETLVGKKASRMPKYIDPLFECEYDVIKKWVDEGMKID